jgi:hypothetical protein
MTYVVNGASMLLLLLLLFSFWGRDAHDVNPVLEGERAGKRS